MPTKKIRMVKNTQDGTVRMVYSDEAAPFLDSIGNVKVARATDIEPVSGILDIPNYGWRATLRDKQSTVLAEECFRKNAIEKEVDYLNTHVITDKERFDSILNGRFEEKAAS